MPDRDPAVEPTPVAFAFRPWVRAACRRAGVWTAVAAVLLVSVVVWQGGVAGAPLARALGVLAFYAALFGLSLAKIWWTAGRPAAGWDQDALWFQTLHRFKPTRIPWSSILAGGIKPGTRAYRLAVLRGDGARERFLNLAVILNHHGFVDGLEHNLLGLGLVRSGDGVARPDWDLESDRIGG